MSRLSNPPPETGRPSTDALSPTTAPWSGDDHPIGTRRPRPRHEHDHPAAASTTESTFGRAPRRPGPHPAQGRHPGVPTSTPRPGHRRTALPTRPAVSA